MEFKPITIQDKNIFDRYLAGTRQELITYCFSSFFLWRDWDPYTWAVAEDALIVKSGYLGLDTICMPISPAEKNVLAAVEAMIAEYARLGKEFIISEVSQSALELLERQWPGRFAAEEYEAGANYIYLREELAALKGSKFTNKRNHLHKFIRGYGDYQLLPLTAELMPGCRELLELWRSRQGQDDREARLEYAGCLDALDHYEQLDHEGRVLTVFGKVVALSIGEMLNSYTYAVHIEKADTDIPGSYQAINCLCAREYPPECIYINRAEDMGDAGLKSSKMSYHPCRMEKKYYVRLK